MSYIFFDCYGGLDLEMMLASLVDMEKNTAAAKKYANFLVADVNLTVSQLKRKGMDACSVYADLTVVPEGTISDIIDRGSLSDETKSRLKLWYKLKSDGMAKDTLTEIKELIYAAVCLELIKSYEVSAIYCSEITQGSCVQTKEGRLNIVPSAHTELLCRMASINVKKQDNCPYEVLSPGAAALIYILNASYMAPRAHSVIKSGYGASCYDSVQFPNVLRCILANDDDAELTIDFESMLSDICADISMLS